MEVSHHNAASICTQSGQILESIVAHPSKSLPSHGLCARNAFT